MKFIHTLPLVALLASSALWAQTSVPVPQPKTVDEATVQRQHASALREKAEADYKVDQDACFKKTLINRCLGQAKTRYTEAVLHARAVDVPAREFLRNAKRADVEAKEAKRVADEPLREAEQKEHVENFRSTEATKAAERQRKIDEKAQQAVEYRRKAAAEQAQREARRAEWEKKDAERARKKASTEAKADADAAARVPKP